jgi:pectate lyase
MKTSPQSRTSRRRVRRRWIAVPAVTATAVAGAVAWTVGASASTLLNVDFDSGAGSWSTSGGNWSLVTDGSRALQQSSTAGDNARKFSGSTSWTTYTLQARVKTLALPRSESGAAVLAHATANTSYDRVVILASGQAQLQSVHSGDVHVLGTVGLNGAVGPWHSVRLQESGSTVSGWIDGRLIGSGASQAGKGRVGLQTLNAAARFDDVKVDTSTSSVPTPVTTPTTLPVTTDPTLSTPTSKPSSSSVMPTGAASTSVSTPPGGGSTSTGANGYAMVNGSTTGGAGGSTVTVSSLSALTTEAAKGGAAIIKVNGMFACSGDITVSSDKSIIGVGKGSGLTGCGLKMKGVSNVIIQNLEIAKVQASSGNGDAVHIEKSDHIWVDHNDLSSDQSHGKDYYDGLVDITHAADYITVSWNYLHDHYKAVLIGHSDSNAAEDTGKLHVTLHHNYFSNVNSRMPSLRFGTAHVYDNYFVDGSTGSHSRMGAQMLVQNNVYRNISTPILTNKDSSQDGYVNESGNDIGTGKNSISRTGSFTKTPYSFALDPTSSVISLVTTRAGTGHIG